MTNIGQIIMQSSSAIMVVIAIITNDCVSDRGSARDQNNLLLQVFLIKWGCQCGLSSTKSLIFGKSLS